MRYVCSHCHATFEAEPEEEENACPSCRAEAGLEPVKDETPPAMQYFGIILLIAVIAAIGGSMVGMAS